MTDVIQLPTTDLTQLFRESLPKHPSLSPQQAHMAALMHRAGRDAPAIAERIEASLGAVMAFLDGLKKAQARKAPLTEASEPEPESAADDGAPALLEAGAQRSGPAAAPPPQLPPPDVELSGLQQAVIRRLRNARVSADTIARMMRLSPDQVQRVAGEIP